MTAAELQAQATAGSAQQPHWRGLGSTNPEAQLQQVQAELNRSLGQNKLLASNMQQKERELAALRQKLAALERSGGAVASGAAPDSGLQQRSAFTVSELQKQVESLRQQLLFKDQEVRAPHLREAALWRGSQGRGQLAGAALCTAQLSLPRCLPRFQLLPAALFPANQWHSEGLNHLCWPACCLLCQVDDIKRQLSASSEKYKAAEATAAELQAQLRQQAAAATAARQQQASGAAAGATSAGRCDILLPGAPSLQLHHHALPVCSLHMPPAPALPSRQWWLFNAASRSPPCHDVSHAGLAVQDAQAPRQRPPRLAAAARSGGSRRGPLALVQRAVQQRQRPQARPSMSLLWQLLLPPPLRGPRCWTLRCLQQPAA